MCFMKQYTFLLTLCVLFAFAATGLAKETAEQKNDKKAEAISSSAETGSNHPEVEEGVSCNDCHTITLDADTTATQMWLNGETMNRQPGEGLMPEDKLWKEIENIIGGIKKESKTYVLGTCLNNVPLTTTAEFTLDPAKKVLYGFHEVGTEKLTHIKNNPKVSLNWHEEFESFADFCCVQIRGRAEIIDGKNKRYDDILISFIPYEDGARLPADATPEQREKRLKTFRESIRDRMVISIITIDMVTVANIDFARQGIRRYQRWTRD